MDAIKDIFGKLADNHFLNSKRFFGALIVLAFTIVLSVSAHIQKLNNNDVQAGGSYAVADETSDEYRKLLTKYYDAVASGNVDGVLEVADPVSDSEKSYIEFLSQYVDKYEIIDIYTKQGTTDGAYLLSARVKIHFKDLKNAAPGLDFFYVETKDNGSLFINNLYSTYNQQNNENPMDPEVASLIAQFEQQEDVLALQADVQKEYNQLMIEDSDFNAFTSETLPQKVQEWAADYKTQITLEAKKQEQEKKEYEEKLGKLIEIQEEQAEAEKKKEEKKKEKEEKEKQKAAEEKKAEESSYKVVTNAKVNMRKKPSKNADSLGKVDDGTTLTAYTTKDDWTKVKYGDEKGWIKTEFLDKKDDDNGDNAEAGDTALYSPGDRVTLSNTVNVRESMSESASKVAVAYSGSTVEVVMMYEEGWTKVEYEGETGYIKSEYLK
ncbi:MAG: SH3 domain-containing protein [Lachnospiraceae bacterium]|nr:SH3 domain-containing protein [Lachnospiraceae bacterium]